MEKFLQGGEVVAVGFDWWASPRMTRPRQAPTSTYKEPKKYPCNCVQHTMAQFGKAPYSIVSIWRSRDSLPISRIHDFELK